MIREFSVQNFLSISEEEKLNFIAKGGDSPIVYTEADGTRLYKLGVFYGANASGKSNVLIAMSQVFNLLITSHVNAKKKIPLYLPFKLREGEPIKMYISFYADSIRYDYYVIYDERRILDEELYYYPKGSKALFYTRSYVGDNLQANIRFGSTLQLLAKTQDGIRENTLNNHSVLSVCGKINFKEDILPFTVLYNWIRIHYHNVDGDENDKGLIEKLKEITTDQKKYKFYLQMLHKADLNITAFHPILVDNHLSEQVRLQIENGDIPSEIKEQLLKPTQVSIVFENNSQNGKFNIPLGLQSRGTLKYLEILESLYDLVSGRHVYFLDELGEDLHYDLLYHFLNVFLFNSGESQLFLTSQETSLLSQDLVNENRGVVWFVDKAPDSASSHYNRGDSYGLHKNLSFYNSYRIGRLGAKPELGSFFIDMED